MSLQLASVRMLNQWDNSRMKIYSKIIHKTQTPGNANLGSTEEDKKIQSSLNVERINKQTSIVTPTGYGYDASPESGDPTAESKNLDSDVQTKDIPESGDLGNAPESGDKNSVLDCNTEKESFDNVSTSKTLKTPDNRQIENRRAKNLTFSSLKSIKPILGAGAAAFLGLAGGSFCLEHSTLASTIILASLGTTISYAKVGGIESYFNQIFKVVEKMFYKAKSMQGKNHDLNDVLKTIGLHDNEIDLFKQQSHIETVEHLIIQDISKTKIILKDIGIHEDRVTMLSEGILAFIHFYSEHDIEMIMDSPTSGKVSVYSNNFDVKSYNPISHRRNVLSFRSQQTSKVSESHSGKGPVKDSNVPPVFDHISPIANSNFNFETHKDELEKRLKELEDRLLQPPIDTRAEYFQTQLDTAQSIELKGGMTKVQSRNACANGGGHGGDDDSDDSSTDDESDNNNRFNRNKSNQDDDSTSKSKSTKAPSSPKKTKPKGGQDGGDDGDDGGDGNADIEDENTDDDKSTSESESDSEDDIYIGSRGIRYMDASKNPLPGIPATRAQVKHFKLKMVIEIKAINADKLVSILEPRVEQPTWTKKKKGKGYKRYKKRRKAYDELNRGILHYIQSTALASNHLLRTRLGKFTCGVKAYDYILKELDPIKRDAMSTSSEAVHNFEALKLTSTSKGAFTKFKERFNDCLDDLIANNINHSDDYLKLALMNKLPAEGYKHLFVVPGYFTDHSLKATLERLSDSAVHIERADEGGNPNKSKKSQIHNTNSDGGELKHSK